MSQVFFDLRNGNLVGHRDCFILQFSKLCTQLFRNHIGTVSQELSEFDEGGTQFFHRHPYPFPF